ncbi:hypothetical protein SAICODRAFT_32224 [Saitoella complicata NRRL Y-17804]|uniref:C2H2-type domain-containing protein n=1 Tax=Saitoella complicata (strain BCRC 22490 / CBS 7301 / JCM 7358 / NBRC 10748 / NRRL Y-17804) TaxID=698492 RepID=A0A0E9NE26_SAICN|nr:uncharacterized protein SAICODRAFT_32224 [Saitoella complicata NRRL Y-17804]ODQ49914.1 hypothetical protein SAICODRAFT_32224 [Saitoella complicata NRRL Y-17804]GAO47665.1 hypothetical protein G7K_1864-t1 [Saitoella complicata NRRL Y-17804]
MSTTTCIVCETNPPKYKCPVADCRAPYCSLGCYKTHKETHVTTTPATVSQPLASSAASTVKTASYLSLEASSASTLPTAVAAISTPAPAIVAPPPPPVTNHLTPAHLAPLTSSTNLQKILQSSPQLLRKLEEIAMLSKEAGDGNATGSAGSVVEHPKRREALSMIAKVREDEVSGGKELMEMILKLIGIEE